MPFEAYGVRLLVSTNSPELYERLPAILPPGAIECSAEQAKHRFALTAHGDGTFGFHVNDIQFLDRLKLDIALEVLQSQLHMHVALDAPDWVFVHAGVVGHGGGAIVMPGRSFSGKTTLVAEFVRAGAIYYSDEYAVLDENGLVHPYAKPLALRGENFEQVDHPVVSLGGIAGERPLPIRTVLVCDYRPGSCWQPSALSPGQAVLAMLSNTVPARSKPAESLRAVTRAVEGAELLQGERGEAAAVVEQLLAHVPA